MGSGFKGVSIVPDVVTPLASLSRGGSGKCDVDLLGGVSTPLKRRSLLIITGGTICMSSTGMSNSLRPQSLADRLLETSSALQDPSLPLFDVHEWEHLVDSSEVGLPHWRKLALEIEQNYMFYDGFVILHGTDTLAYTASALSFMLENLNKPVVLTGSMLPLSHVQTDARRNLAVALMISAYSEITEVCVLFGSRLLRGNRARKLDCGQMDAFQSPNFPPLGRVGVDITIDEQLLLMPSKLGFRVFHHFCMNIVLVTVTPGFQPQLLRYLFSSPSRPLAVILLLYGTGTAPTQDSELLLTIRLGVLRGVEIVCLTQCPSGTCSLLTYENGALLYHLGIIEGKDMTPEAAFSKLAYLIGKGYSGDALRHMMERNIRGDLTERPPQVTGQAALTPVVDRRSALVSELNELSIDQIYERLRNLRSNAHTLHPNQQQTPPPIEAPKSADLGTYALLGTRGEQQQLPSSGSGVLTNSDRGMLSASSSLEPLGEEAVLLLQPTAQLSDGEGAPDRRDTSTNTPNIDEVEGGGSGKRDGEMIHRSRSVLTGEALKPCCSDVIFERSNEDTEGVPTDLKTLEKLHLGASRRPRFGCTMTPTSKRTGRPRNTSGSGVEINIHPECSAVIHADETHPFRKDAALIPRPRRRHRSL